MKIYLASSWRNTFQPDVFWKLMNQPGFDVYDFRNPTDTNKGFSWKEVSTRPVEVWTFEEYKQILQHPIAEEGFRLDYSSMQEADCCVLLLPCGRSAHLEAGYFVGANKPLFIYIPVFDTPELMYKMAKLITNSIDDLILELGRYSEWLSS